MPVSSDKNEPNDSIKTRNQTNDKIKNGRKKSFFEKLFSRQKALHKIIIGVIVAIASSILIYFIHEYLNREILTIESITIRPRDILLRLPKDIDDFFKKMASKKIFYISLNENILTEKFARSLLERLHREKQNTDTKLERMRKDNSFITAQLKNPEASISSEFYRLVTDYETRDMPISQDSLKQIARIVEDRIKKKEEAKILMEKAIHKLVAFFLSTFPENQFQVEIIIFNSGKTQSVVKHKGQLIFGNEIINLKKKERRPNRYLKVEEDTLFDRFLVVQEKSFNGMTLVVDEYNNRQRMIDLGMREFVAGQRMAKLSFFDIRNKPIFSKDFLFRCEIEESKENFRQYIESNYSPYLPQRGNVSVK